MWFLASLCVGLGLLATLVPIWLEVSTALSEMVIPTMIADMFFMPSHRLADSTPTADAEALGEGSM